MAGKVLHPQTFLISLAWGLKPSHCSGSFEKIAIHPGMTSARSPMQYSGKGVFRPSTCHVSQYQFKKGQDDIYLIWSCPILSYPLLYLSYPQSLYKYVYIYTYMCYYIHFKLLLLVSFYWLSSQEDHASHWKKGVRNSPIQTQPNKTPLNFKHLNSNQPTKRPQKNGPLPAPPIFSIITRWDLTFEVLSEF